MSKKQEKQELDERASAQLNVMLKGYLSNVEEVKTVIIKMQNDLEQAHHTQLGMEQAIWELRDILELPQLEPPARMQSTIAEG